MTKAKENELVYFTPEEITILDGLKSSSIPTPKRKKNLALHISQEKGVLKLGLKRRNNIIRFGMFNQ